jgi:hypothetical protein
MTSTRIRNTLLMASAIALVGAVSSARADLVSWNVDPTASFVRLNIPDQTLTIGTTTATVRMRDAGSNSNWTDAGGRRAFLDGTLSTNLVDGTYVQFYSGQHNLEALEQTNLRPNPAAYNPGVTNAENPDGTYGNTSTAAAALGARVRATVSILTVDAAFLALRDVLFDLASGAIPLGGGNSIAGSTTALGIQSSLGDLDGLSIILVGQPIPDTLNAPISTPNQVNTSGGTITNLGGLNRRLDLSVTMSLNLDLDGTPIMGTVTGNLRAFAVIPEPSSIALLSVGTAAFGLTAYRRRRVRK